MGTPGGFEIILLAIAAIFIFFFVLRMFKESNQDSLTENTTKEKSLFTTEGRIGRFSFFLRSMILFVPFFYLYSLDLTGNAVIIQYSIMSALGVFGGIQASKRFHDLNKSSYYTLLFLLPLINIFLLFFLSLKRGNKGSNRFGANPIMHDKPLNFQSVSNESKSQNT